jgi:hypothetical protein
MPTTAKFMSELADREAIRDCLYRYSRAVDRCDEDLLRSVYWEDAVDDHVLFSGTREELIVWVMPLLRHMTQAMHSISNILMRIDGDKADAESYYYGYHRVPNGDGFLDSIQSGRYLDKFERRNDEWRIARRRVVVDWFRDYAEAADWEKGPMGHRMQFGLRRPEDPSYSMLDLR